MLKFGPTGFDPDFLSNPENLNLTERFDAFPTDGGAGVLAMAVDNPLTGLSLQLDGGFLDALFAEGGTTVGGDGAGRPGDHVAPGFGSGISDAGISDDGPEVGIAAAGTFEPGERGFFATQVSEDFATGFRTDELPINAISFSAESGPGASGAPADSDLIFLDLQFSAKGGIPGPPGGNGGGGGDGDDGVVKTYTSGPDGGYNIQIDFKGSWTVDLQAGVMSSADLMSVLITGDIADVFWRGDIIDDITIDAKLVGIDNEGGVLGRAGPTAIRTDGFLPATAIMEFDKVDAPILNSMPSELAGEMVWDDVVLHEMMHSIGFGTIWTYLDLLSDDGTAFTGPDATSVYKTASGETGGVPVDGGHWDEQTFGNEIMTPYINIAEWGSTTKVSDNYLSEMTVASLEDLAYETLWEPTDTTDPLWDSVNIFIG